jgi:hypothetical protein
MPPATGNLTENSAPCGVLEAEMTQAEIRALEHAGRSTAVWNNEVYDNSPHFGEVARALFPAALILATATALLVALL